MTEREKEITMEPTLEMLRKASQTAQHAFWKAEAAERDKTNATLVGKCFKYRNSSGGTEKWWLYVKITAVDDGNLRAFKFQQYSNGEIHIHSSDFIYPGRSLTEDGGYIKINAAEYNREWAKLHTIIAGYGASLTASRT